MKIRSSNQLHERGSVLLVSMMISAITGVTLASYLIMTQSQNTSVVRSQTWNSAIAVSEAGVEDALAMLNKYAGSFDQVANWSTSASLTQDNWTDLGGGVCYVRRYLPGGNYYDLYVTNNNNNPVITCRSTVPWTYAYNNSPQTMFAAAGVSQSTAPTMLNRSVAVETRYDGMFRVAMAAILQVDLKGFNVSSDSFDSGDANYSNWQGSYGIYPSGDVSKTKANGDIVTDFTVVNALNAGNAKVKGQVKTGPNGTIGIGPNGSVGDRPWVEGGTTGIQAGHSANDMNVYFPPATLPVTTWVPSAKGDYIHNGIHYDYHITSSGDYTIPGLAKSLYIGAPSGAAIRVRLKVTGDVSLTGSGDEIRVATGATILFYMNSANCVIKGNGVVNDNNQAINFQYIGLPNNTSLAYGGNGTFTGSIYAPNADFTLGGGGSDVKDFIGSSVTKTVKMNGSYNFHYDENLARVGPARGYIPINWKEQ